MKPYLSLLAPFLVLSALVDYPAVSIGFISVASASPGADQVSAVPIELDGANPLAKRFLEQSISGKWSLKETVYASDSPWGELDSPFPKIWKIRYSNGKISVWQYGGDLQTPASFLPVDVKRASVDGDTLTLEIRSVKNSPDGTIIKEATSYSAKIGDEDSVTGTFFTSTTFSGVMGQFGSRKKGGIVMGRLGENTFDTPANSSQGGVPPIPSSGLQGAVIFPQIGMGAPGGGESLLSMMHRLRDLKESRASAQRTADTVSSVITRSSILDQVAQYDRMIADLEEKISQAGGR